MNKKKVAVISSYYHNWNMGGLLQSYALNRVIRELGYDAVHIRLCYAEPATSNSPIRKRIRTVLTRHRISAELIEWFYSLAQGELKNRRSFRRFHDHNIHGSTCCYDAITAKRLNRFFDIFVTGSDQIWNPEFWSDRLLGVYGLLFTNKEKQTISYAASVGSERSIKGREDVFQSILSKLDYISVREESAKKSLQIITEKPIFVSLDPTLLLDASYWEKVAADYSPLEPYLFAYFLEEKEPHTSQLHYVAETMDLPIYCISKEMNCYLRSREDRQIADAGPEEFLNYILCSDVVVTNSFHGMVFSVLFRKQFWVVKRYGDSEKDSANNRIIDFLNMLNLNDRLLQDNEYPDEEQLKSTIDYEEVHKILKDKRVESLQWLKDALDHK